MTRYDLAVVGGGTAGLTAAVGAAGVGARVCLIERDRTGGDCLWTGCVPSKSLLAAAKVAHAMRTAARFGLPTLDPEVDLGAVMDHVHGAIHAIEPHDSPERLRREGVEVVHGQARFSGPRTLEVDGRTVRFRRALIATGSHPLIPPIDGLDDVDHLTSDTVWELRELPGRLLVLGGGPIGCELGQAFARLGSEVTLVEMLDRLLPEDEPRAAEVLAARLSAEGLDVRTATTATSVRRHADGVTVSLRSDAGEHEVTVDRLLVATGRRPTTSGLSLEAAGVELDDDGYVVVDATLRTSNPAIMAAGDVCGRPPFTHVAGHDGGLTVANALLGTRRKVERRVVPWVTYTDPEVGHVGLTIEQARAEHGDGAIVTSFEHGELDRAVTESDTDGFSLLVADPRGKLLGGTVVGPRAGEVIAELAAWLRGGATLDDVGRTIHPYPTHSEGIHRAALEYLRGKYLSDRVRALLRPVLWVLRFVDRLRHP